MSEEIQPLLRDEEQHSVYSESCRGIARSDITGKPKMGSSNVAPGPPVNKTTPSVDPSITIPNVDKSATMSSRNRYVPTTPKVATTTTTTTRDANPSVPNITGNKVGPQRTSRTAQKLKLLPDEPFKRGEDGEDDILDREVYSQVNRITDKPARRDAEKLGKSHRHLLPRVTAYCTASSYNMKELVRWLKDCKRTHHTHQKLFDECLYTPFIYTDWRGDKRFEHEDVIRLDDEGGEINVSDKQPDLFIFAYGVVVMWGFTEREEKAFLNDLEKFEKEKLAEEDVQVEEFNYYITQSYQPRIYNDFITLRDGSNYMIKLSISHAAAQSVKISLFEELVDNTIEDTQDIPQEIASSGKVSMSKADIMKSIGELFILRININLHGSILDSPEIMWSEPQLEPIYQATRGYLEINQRVALLNQRLEVVSDLLQMLKEQLGHSHEENLEFIVLLLLAVEVLISVVNIVVDLLADIK
ncbi:HEL003Wp [Eremothecium sinecaudum]|uniref:HEL003Wp n=1 Tax=Eremothecium sinecaudum TaxID=45286 RepID=A0A0X8HTL1_9SACH|nr:HEL003Wp [Eremothecium sinecaudum]AMD21277.1 HEL003Wp [Eremothecium sinecaudum]